MRYIIWLSNQKDDLPVEYGTIARSILDDWVGIEEGVERKWWLGQEGICKFKPRPAPSLESDPCIREGVPPALTYLGRWMKDVASS